MSRTSQDPLPVTREDREAALAKKLSTFSNAATPGPYSAEGFDAIHASVDGLDAGDMILGGDGETIVAQCIMPRDMALILTMLNGLPDIINSLATHPAPPAQPGREEKACPVCYTHCGADDPDKCPHGDEVAPMRATCDAALSAAEPLLARQEAEPVADDVASPIRSAYLCGFEQALYNRDLPVEQFYDAWCSHGWDYEPDIVEINTLRVSFPATLPPEPASVREERLREALAGLERACDDLAATRSVGTYVRMLDEDKAQPQIEALERARQEARAALSTEEPKL